MVKRPPEDQMPKEVVVVSHEVQPVSTVGPEAEEIERLAHQYCLERGSRAEAVINLRRQHLEQEGNND